MSSTKETYPINRTPPGFSAQVQATESEIAAARKRTVRLIVSIPALLALIQMAGGVFIRNELLTISRTSGALAPVRQGLEFSADFVLGMSGVCAALAAAVGLVLAWSIVRPLRSIELRMLDIARGDLTALSTLPQLGELGFMGRTFNQMVGQLHRVFEERDRLLRQASSRARIQIDETGQVRSAEQSVRRLLNLDPAELIGVNLLKEPGAPEQPGSTLAFLRREVRGLIEESRAGILSEHQIEIEREEEPMILLLSIAPVLVGESTSPQFLLEVRDITGMVSFHQQMQRTDRLAAVGTLATGIAHEIRNPLASIKGMVQLMAESARMQSGGATEEESEFHERVIKEVVRLEGLVSAIMDFAQGEDVPPEPTDVNALLCEAVEASRQAVETEAIIEVAYELDETLPLANMQAHRLQQAFLNLTRNAFQALAENGGRIRIHSLHLPVNEERPIILCIANTGEPIAPEQRERIFEPFFTTKAEGTGLGLPIAYQAVAANGGMLELECEGGEIQFWVRLPLDVTRSTQFKSRTVRKL